MCVEIYICVKVGARRCDAFVTASGIVENDDAVCVCDGERKYGK